MLNLIRLRNKYVLFILIQLSILQVSCSMDKNKVYDGTELVQKYFETGDDSGFSKCINSKIELNGMLKNGIRCYSSNRVNEKYSRKIIPSKYLYLYINDTDYSRGMLALLIDVYKKGEFIENNVENEDRVMILKDFNSIPGFSSTRTDVKNVCYGDPIIAQGYKSYKCDENIYGIYESLSDPSDNEEISPKYLLYISKGELKLEEAKDDKYFIFIPYDL